MNISDRFNKAGDHCLSMAGSKSFLVGAFVGAAVTLPFSNTIAVGCLGAPAIYGTIGAAQKLIGQLLDGPRST